MTQAVRENDPCGPAPAPYSTVDVGSSTSFHAYIVDANGRKIGVAWGPLAEKVWTAALFAASPDLLAACKAALREMNARIDFATENNEPVPVFVGIADLHAAIAKAEGREP